MDQAVSALQNAINRFAAVGGFPRVAVDGLWGAKTRQGVFSALAFIGQGKCYQSVCPHEDTSRAAAQIMAQWDETVGSVVGLGEFIGGVADTLGLPHVASPVATPGGGGSPGPIVLPSSGVPMPFLERLRAMPTWQQVLLGIAASLGLILIVNRIKRT